MSKIGSPELLKRTLIQTFDRQELRTLCFSLGIDYDELRGKTLNDKVNELIQVCQMYDKLSELAYYVSQING